MSTSHSFGSALGPTITSYLALKKALGRRFAAETTILAQLDRFLVARRPDHASLTPDSFAAWSLTLAHLTPTVRRNRMRIVRNLCLYLRRSDPGCFVPDSSGFPAPHTPRRPHIFTEAQIVRLLHAAASLRPRSTSPLCAEVFRLAIVLLYTAGLRRGELVRLVLSDYDPAERTLLVRASKFHKSRLVALSRDAAHEVDLYLRARRRLPHDADAPLLVSCSGGLRAYWGASLGRGLRRLFRSADVRTAEGRLPRVHDTRHTYAVHVLLRWYRAGVDVQTKLPALATAMGHVSVASTAYYLAFLDPIAEAASERFARHSQHLFDALPGGGGSR
ncbi:MAG: tyrosine-type recombinase/integrase [Myxococcota bacterium]